MVEIADELVRELPDLRAAILACIKVSGLPLKAVAYDTGIEYSHLSKMVKGNSADPRHFPPEKIDLLQDVCGNEIPLRWQMLRRGYPSPGEIRRMEAELARLRSELGKVRESAQQVVNVFKIMDGGLR